MQNTPIFLFLIAPFFAEHPTSGFQIRYPFQCSTNGLILQVVEIPKLCHVTSHLKQKQVNKNSNNKPPSKQKTFNKILIQRNRRQLFILVVNFLYFSTPGHFLCICQSVLQYTETLRLKNIIIAI